MAGLSYADLFKGNKHSFKISKSNNMDNVHKQIFIDNQYIELAIDLCRDFGRSRIPLSTIENVVAVLKLDTLTPLEKAKNICKNILKFKHDVDCEGILNRFYI